MIRADRKRWDNAVLIAFFIHSPYEIVYNTHIVDDWRNWANIPASPDGNNKEVNSFGDINNRGMNNSGDNSKEMNTDNDTSRDMNIGGDINTKEKNIGGDINRVFGEQFPIQQGDVNLYSPLVLAYAGDAVYELYIRTLLLSQGNAPVHKLHKRSITYVKAKAQSDIIHRLMDLLTSEEQDIVRRGRNAKSGTIPKNADVTEYKYATGFEALIGYLYLKGDYARLLEVLKMSVEQGQTGYKPENEQK